MWFYLLAIILVPVGLALVSHLSERVWVAETAEVLEYPGLEQDLELDRAA